MLTGFRTDARDVTRALRRGWGPLIVAVSALAIGIAATITMLAVIDAIDLRPLPFRNGDELVEITQRPEEETPGCTDCQSRVSPGVYSEWNRSEGVLGPLAAASSVAASLDSEGPVLDAARTTDEFLETLQVTAVLGRSFLAGERDLVISYELWNRRFGRDPTVLGRRVQLAWAGEFRSVPAAEYRVVGVLPQGMRYPAGAQLWFRASDGFGVSREDQTLAVVGRLRPGQSLQAATSSLATLTRALAAERPASESRWVSSVSTLRDAVRRTGEEAGTSARFALLAVAGFVLLLATFNLANVFFARVVGRQRAIAIRTALGAPRVRVVRTLTLEALAITAMASVVGFALAVTGVRLVDQHLRVASTGVQATLDTRMILASLGICLSIAAVLLIAPVFRFAAGRSISVRAGLEKEARHSGRLDYLIVGQVAFALLILEGAAFFGTEYLRLTTRPLGFDVRKLAVAALPLSMDVLPADANRSARALERQLTEAPDIVSAATGALPAEGYEYLLDADTLTGMRRPVSYRASPDYFSTLGIRSLSGRVFTSQDRSGSPPVGIVNATAARRWWPRASAIGRTVEMTRSAGVRELVQIVGVVEDELVLRNRSVEVGPVLYRPFDQLVSERRRSYLFVRARGSLQPALVQLGRAIRSGSGGAAYQGEAVYPLETMIGRSVAAQRLRATSLAGFSAIAILIATLGVYSLASAAASQRSREIAIRLAVGAKGSEVAWLIARRGALMGLLGVAIGSAMWLVTAELVPLFASFGSGIDRSVGIATAGLLLGTALLASYVPARRATLLSLSGALREP